MPATKVSQGLPNPSRSGLGTQQSVPSHGTRAKGPLRGSAALLAVTHLRSQFRPNPLAWGSFGKGDFGRSTQAQSPGKNSVVHW